MVLAVDVYYYESSARAVGILFNWTDEAPVSVIIEELDTIQDYIPGEFYKRELPGILKIIENTNPSEIEALVVDGYVYIDNDGGFGLGGHTWKTLNEKIPVIGVAKTSFWNNKKTVETLTRGNSKNPLYISSIGIELEKAVGLIENMHGEFRIPTLLKELDKITRTEMD